jgi:hypothetical protein
MAKTTSDRLGLSEYAYAGLQWAAYRFGLIRLGDPLVASDLRRLAPYEDDRIRREAPGLRDKDLAEIRRALSDAVTSGGEG